MKKIIFVLILFLLLISLTACALPADGFELSFSTANMTNATMTTALEDGAPVDSVTGYAQDAEKLIVVGILNNAPDDTSIKFVWNYLTDPMVIDEVIIESVGDSGVYIYSTLTNDGLWPIGDYSVDLFIDDRDEPDATVKFSVN